jgi:L-seryl-tRNA(Ser) seleniumtransferase
MNDHPYRRLPAVSDVLARPGLAGCEARRGRQATRDAVRAVLEACRASIAAGRVAETEVDPDALARRAAAILESDRPGLRRVLNATGILLHTGLGRAPLAAEAADAVDAVVRGYCNLEFDLESGERGRRTSGVAELLCRLTGAEAATVVNNNAAATVLALRALAMGREVVVSRGQLVEIGGSFRLPEIFAVSGARLREVGTTNRTTLTDYERAVGPDTGCILAVHPSNFRVEGFTAAVPVAALATIGPPVVHDIGSGLLRPHPLLPDEPDAASSLRDGAAVVTCSGDKLLGGPQAGLVLGERDTVDRLRRHPLARALRADKLTLAALEATVRGPRVPVLDALEADPAVLFARCRAVTEAVAPELGAQTVEAEGVVGGGGAPGLRLPGWAVSLPESYAERLRTGVPAVLARIERGRCLVDLRCVPAASDPLVVKAIRDAGRGESR